MPRAPAHRRIDLTNIAQDRKIAAKLRRGAWVLGVARRNLRRWMVRDGQKLRPVFQEWHLILTRLSRAEIAEFLCSDTPMARRLRQSSPFAGVLSAVERMAIRQRHEKTRISKNAA